ncbi:MAG: hypothetical protein A2X49_11225 [Lentisphaerae bacterium GWF2_52_8]|nr:MAG: hypothetical protein A2X49_11225 [Lentisphaerae bacterium GWF2_52_8]
MDVKKGCRIISLSQGRQKIHENYGLWICRTLQKAVFGPREKIHPRSFEFFCLSHMIGGKGWYWSQKTGTVKILEEGQGIISSPGFVQFYSGNKENYIEDSICFTGVIAQNLFRSGIIRDGIINIGKGRRLLPIIDSAADPAMDSQIRANQSLLNLLTDLYFENRNKGKENIESAFETLLRSISEEPGKWWTVKEMAEWCNLSINHFRRLFLARTGLNPKGYVDNLKINKALEFLSDNDASISEIAGRLGYLDQYHFSRRFKEITGFSPLRYRLEFLQPPAKH